MGEVLGAIVPLALVITISPIPIVAQILVLFTEAPKANAAAYLMGFVAGVAAAFALLVGLAQVLDAAAAGSDRSSLRSWVMVGFGVVLLVGAARRFVKRPRGDEEPQMPGWMDRIASLTPWRSLVLGAGVGLLNPKNLVAVVPAAAVIGSSSLGTVESVGAAAVFVVVSAAGVTVPLAAAVVMGKRADPVLRRWKDWLTRNNALVMALLFLVLGAWLVVDGMSGL